jgi:hypothetical protein
LTPFTPGGAGAQQALLVYVFRGAASKTTVLAYSVGQQIALAAFNVALAFGAIFLMSGTLNLKSVIRRGEADRREEPAPTEPSTVPDPGAPTPHPTPPGSS